MPVRPSVTNAMEVVLKGHFLSNNAKCTNVMGAFKTAMTQADGVALAAAVAGVLAAQVGGYGSNLFWDEVTVTSLDHTNSFSTTASVNAQGTRAGDNLNPAYCKVVMLRTATGTRSGTGRMYVPGMVRSDVTLLQDSIYVALAITNARALVSDLVAGINTVATASVVSFKRRNTFPITGNSVTSLKINFVTARSENF